MEKRIFNYLSECQTQDSHFVCECLSHFLCLPILLPIHGLVLFSDNGVKSGELLFTLFSQKSPIHNLGKQIIYSNFESQHGKNPCDTHFGEFKSRLKTCQVSEKTVEYSEFLNMCRSKWNCNNAKELNRVTFFEFLFFWVL